MRHILLLRSVFLTLLLCNLLFVDVMPYLFKLVLGLSGALVCFVLFKKVTDSLSMSPLLLCLTKWGRVTLGVYIIQAIVLEFLLPRYVSFAALPMPVIVTLMPVLSLLMLAFCLLAISTISRSQILAFLLFGREF